ncbi:[FeFe] hydrogenase H-cluster maturation GTPase HydF [Thermospira aquatica]|uniref:[FeFe] hydrogenase H-cluster maturation GTPase HydF n=1 Tax=Thermospira aquatica TaxID=2828656 RepID=UPI0038CD4AEC
MLESFEATGRPLLVVCTFYKGEIHPSKEFLTHKRWVAVDNVTREGVGEVKKKLLELRHFLQPEPGILDGLVRENDFVLLVVPIDLAAPKGRLILPQVETIRELLDRDCGVMVVKERELKMFYDRLGMKPSLVITDSQVFHKVASDIPPDQPLTSFSILMARKKGDLIPFIQSLPRFRNMQSGSRILILEMCSHHRQPDDIGTVKIPRLFGQMIEPTVTFDWKKQLVHPEELTSYDGVIMCGGCMVSRRQYENTMDLIQSQGKPLLNYGLFFAWVNGLLPRAIEMFPEVYEVYQQLETVSF